MPEPTNNSSPQTPPQSGPQQGPSDPGSQGSSSTSANSGTATAQPVAQLPLYLRMFMDKTAGLTIEVLDASGINQQSITMDGVKLTTRVSGAQGDSVITQTADAVSIDARTFSVQAETSA